ncbi:MAG: asparagine synthase C-terminal domain-containing protein [Actinomycetaceae bacterium]|nr:asparagine synthase C-terminal domain-containing protein [Actinomycetaceae bacterium]
MDIKIIAPSTASHRLHEDGLEVWELHALTPVSALPGNPSDMELRQRSGHWARIEADDRQVRLYTDRIMSFPLYYARSGDQWVVGGDVYQVAQAANRQTRNENAARELLNCAHTLSHHTLFDGVYAVEAGTRVTLTADGVSRHCWGQPRYATAGTTDARQFGEEFDRELTKAFADAVQNLGGKQVVVPLSGGIDSRLLVLYLRKVQAPNVIAFTYGKPGSREVETSRAVAEKLGIPWHGVELPTNQMRATWNSSEGGQFARATWSGFALPHVQDWWALRQLRAKGVLRPGDVVFPGHTIVGNMHHFEVFDTPWDRGEIGRAVAEHHWCLRTRGPRSKADWELVRRALAEAMKETKWAVEEGDDTVAARRSTQDLVEWVNLKHRQAKYINNSMRPYEYFELNWAMPMLDSNVWNAWLQGSEQLTAERHWYRQFTDEMWEEYTGEQVQYFAPASTAMNPRVKAAALSLMRVSGADRTLSKARSIRSQLNHPMAFEAFATGHSQRQLATELLRGRTQMGVWTKLFLENQWTGGEPVVP